MLLSVRRSIFFSLGETMANDLFDLSSQQLVAHLRDLIWQHKKLEVEIIEALHVIICRRMHLQSGFSNLGDYCQEVFGISQDIAWKRSLVARVIGPFPGLLELLRSGKTHLSHLAMVPRELR